MSHETQYSSLPRPSRGLPHGYGPNVHLLSYPWAMSVLSRLCSPDCTQPEVNRLVTRLFTLLLHEAASHILLTEQVAMPTRMVDTHPQAGVYRGECIRRDQRAVVVDVARAGILPSHVVYEGLHDVLAPEGIRQDHVVASRTTDADGKVTGVQLDGSKIGGDVQDAAVLIPDPMAATGSSISGVIRHYVAGGLGQPRVAAALHLILTPEYLRRVTTEFPHLQVFAIRLDRGLSPADVLATPPGTHWDRERGLSEIQYIVPGAGGVGEVLNNSWV